MTHWWEIEIRQPAGEEPKLRAVAYYRHSAQDRQQNSIPIQQEQVREWAQKNGVEIIHEFADAGKSGLTAEDRPAFTELMEQWVKQRKDFTYILCLDVSRWGRFQDLDLSAQYSAECKKHGKQVIYTSIGKPREDDAAGVAAVKTEPSNPNDPSPDQSARDDPPLTIGRNPYTFDLRSSDRRRNSCPHDWPVAICPINHFPDEQLPF
jgi:hypothetical protein